MSSPTNLGVAGLASDDSGSVGTLTVTTFFDIPATTGCVVLALLLAFVYDGSTPPTVDASTITDDSGGSNVYQVYPEGSNNGLSYDVGRPGPGPLGSRNTFGHDGDTPPTGCSVTLIFMFPATDLPSGTNISIPLAGTGLEGGNYQAAEAIALGFTSSTGYTTLEASAAGQLIDPTDTSDETGANVPLGDHLFSELDPVGSQYVCFVAIQGSSITGTGVIYDNGGNWTDQNDGSFVDDLIEWTLFTIDGDTVDQTQAIIQFAESTAGVDVDSCWTICPVTTFVPVLVNYPVFEHMFRAGD